MSLTLKKIFAVVLNIGHLLIFPLKELPQLAKGKGNKMINISEQASRYARRICERHGRVEA